MLRRFSAGLGVLIGVVGLLFLGGAGLSLAQERGSAPPPDAPHSVDASLVGTAFTYQGRLTGPSGAVSDTCSMAFRLFDAATNGQMVGNPLTLTVPVTDSLFTVSLDFGTSAFTGDARWLQTRVRCPANSGSYALLTPRQPLTAAPYALGLRPGAMMSGTANNTTTLTIYNTGPGLVLYSEDSVALDAVSLGGRAIFAQAVDHEALYAITANASTAQFHGAGQGVMSATVVAHNDFYNSGIPGGISLYAYNQSDDATIVSRNLGTGDVFQGFTSGGDRSFRVTNNGTVYADNSYNCGLGSSCFNSGSGADVAERIDAGEALGPGDVVEIDPAADGGYRLCRTANSTLVAGVISTSPGVTMGNNDLAGNDSGVRSDARPLLALVGQVPVKVSAENGAIHPGDLLVAAGRPGYAMRAGDDPAPGTLIGKALGSLASGTGVIKMLVMLN